MIQRTMLGRRMTFILMAWLTPALAHAQTADLFFGGWSWRSREPGSRPAGLGGTYVAVADGVRTTAINPAGLALIPRVEAAGGIAPRWVGLARRLRGAERVQPVTPGAPGAVRCPAPARARPWTVAVYVEQPDTQRNELEAVHGPGIGEAATLEAASEELGAGVAKGLTPWLDLGATLAWRHLRLDGRSVVSDALEHEQQRVILAGDANKARAIVGALASLGSGGTPGVRLGVAYQWDLVEWSVERTSVDRARGVAGPATQVDILEPPVLSAGMAWRLSDNWLVAGQIDYTWYDRVAKATARLAPPGSRFVVGDHFEPRGAIEMTRSSPIGGYYKVRAGLRREIPGRVAYEGTDPVLRQAFLGSPAAFRGSFGFSLLAEFYEKALRLDVDISQVVLQRRSSLSAAGTRRISIGLTGRL